jgi:superfamily I DNA/RNA helicase
VFASFGDTLGATIAYADDLFKRQGPIQLLSGHKAKGLEWGTVYHLDPWRIPSTYAESAEEVEQELNVRYVIETRAKERLYLVDRKGFRQ